MEACSVVRGSCSETLDRKIRDRKMEVESLGARPDTAVYRKLGELAFQRRRKMDHVRLFGGVWEVGRLREGLRLRLRLRFGFEILVWVRGYLLWGVIRFRGRVLWISRSARARRSWAQAV